MEGNAESHNKDMGKSTRWYVSRIRKGRIAHDDLYRKLRNVGAKTVECTSAYALGNREAVTRTDNSKRRKECHHRDNSEATSCTTFGHDKNISTEVTWTRSDKGTHNGDLAKSSREHARRGKENGIETHGSEDYSF